MKNLSLQTFRLSKIFYLLAFLFFINCSGTKPPVLLTKDVQPDYPLQAQKEGKSGKVLLNLFITADGNIDKVRISKSSGYKILDDAAVEYGKKLRFTPANKGGKPKSVVMTWLVTYEALTAFFQPKEYAAKIQDFYKFADQVSGKEKSDVLDKILLEHDEYVSYSLNHFFENFNEQIKLFLLPEVANQWSVFFENWPLRFVVYHDFIMRFPSSEKTSFATSKMIELLKDDIKNIKSRAKSVTSIERNRVVYLKTIYSFLHNNYPESITADMKTEADQYLNM
jgi:TonB family protein